MELRQLEYFLAVASHGSFTAAAKEVSVVQSALSTSVRNLERELSAPLFERTTRRVELTEAGRAFVPAARRILAEVQAARLGVAAIAGLDAGQVAIGAIQTLTSVNLPARLAAFHADHPGVRIIVRDAPVAGLVEDLRAGDLDLAYVSLDGGAADGLATFATHTEQLVVALPPDHRLAGAVGVGMGELAEDTFVAFRTGTGLETTARRLAETAGVRRRVGCQVSQIDLLVELVRAGLGVAVLPATVAERAGLPFAVLDDPTACRRIALVSREPRPVNPVAAALLEHLLAEPVQATNG